MQELFYIIEVFTGQDETQLVKLRDTNNPF